MKMPDLTRHKFQVLLLFVLCVLEKFARMHTLAMRLALGDPPHLPRYRPYNLYFFQ